MKTYSHYESLNVTRDAPAEVIRAAYRSLSQKYHPDKNFGDLDAEHMMSRLNTAYSVLSDPDQRKQYDLHILSGNYGAAANSPFSADARDRSHDYVWNKKLVAIAAGSISLVVATISLYLWNDHRSTLRIEQSLINVADAPAAPEPGWPGWQQGEARAPNGAAKKHSSVPIIDMAGPTGLETGVTEPSNTRPSQKAPAPQAAPVKTSEFERLTAMLKSMGLGLHKLDAPTQASNSKPAAAPAKPAEPAKSAETAVAAAAPPAPAAKPAAPSEATRVREEPAKPAAPEPVRSESKVPADAGRPAAQPVSSQTTSSANRAPRNLVFADAQGCSTPSYPTRAYRNGESGTVLLGLLVGTDGRVIETKVQKSSGSSELDKAARKAVAPCKFKPLEGQTEPVWTKMMFEWTLDGGN